MSTSTGAQSLPWASQTGQVLSFKVQLRIPSNYKVLAGLSLSPWASKLYVKMTRKMRAKIERRARRLNKQMVTVGRSRGGRKQVLLDCNYAQGIRRQVVNSRF